MTGSATITPSRARGHGLARPLAATFVLACLAVALVLVLQAAPAGAAGRASVDQATPTITITAPTESATCQRRGTITVSWTTDVLVGSGQFGVGLEEPDGTDHLIVNVRPTGKSRTYEEEVRLDVPIAKGYRVFVGWLRSDLVSRYTPFVLSEAVIDVKGAQPIISAFSFPGAKKPIDGAIDRAKHRISVIVPRDVDVGSLVASIDTNADRVTVGGTPQMSGVTANDFTEPVTYTVASDDPAATQTYVVVVRRMPAKLPIGKEFAGGLVAYIFKPGDRFYVEGETHGLIVSAEDVGTSPINWYWHTSGKLIGVSETRVGAGARNTAEIVEALGNEHSRYAAGRAAAYRGGNYDDWFLPSKDELGLMQGHAEKLYFRERYWSSSEVGLKEAWAQWTTTGKWTQREKWQQAFVRAVRLF